MTLPGVGDVAGEDLLLLRGATVSLYVDGSELGLTDATENIAGLWVEPGTDVLFLTTVGAFDTGEVSGRGTDVLGFIPEMTGPSTSGAFQLFDLPFDLPPDISFDAIHIQTNESTVATIGDTVFLDANANGTHEPYEPGMEGVRVSLLNALGDVVGDTTTNEYGEFQFTNLEPGSFRLKFHRPRGYNFTAPHRGSDDSIDSDAHPATGLTQLVTLVETEVNAELDAGLRPAWPHQPIFPGAGAGSISSVGIPDNARLSLTAVNQPRAPTRHHDDTFARHNDEEMDDRYRVVDSVFQQIGA